MLPDGANSSLVFVEVQHMYSGTIRSDTITSLEPLVINLVEGIWMSLFLRSAERRRFLLSMIVRYVVVCRCMSLYVVVCGNSCLSSYAVFSCMVLLP